jgi:hypothetical protein
MSVRRRLGRGVAARLLRHCLPLNAEVDKSALAVPIEDEARHLAVADVEQVRAL